MSFTDLEPIEQLELPESVRDPSAVGVVAQAEGVSEAAMTALVNRQVYRTADGYFLWPWYRTQDAEIRPAAEQRAAELGVGMPPFLDEPYESAFYLRHTGESLFREIADEHGLADELWLERVPIYDPGAFDVIEVAGLTAPHPVLQYADKLQSVVDDFDWADTDYHRQELVQSLTLIVDAYFAALRGRPQVYPRTIELSGPSEFDEPDRTSIGPLFFTDRGIVVQALNQLVVFDEGVVTARFEVDGELQFASRQTALVWENGWRALDLASGYWLDGTIDCHEVFGGPLIPPPLDYESRHHDGPAQDCPHTPDGMFAWHDGVLRLEDGMWVTYGDPFDDVRWDREPSGRTLHGIGALEDAVVTVIDGVTFRHRQPRTFSLRDDPLPALALHSSGWRAVFDDALWTTEDHVCDVGPTYGAAFRADAEAVAMLTATHLVEVDWTGEPRVVRAMPFVDWVEPREQP